ncbi:hypothetical protein ACUR5C_00250 [Aliikangiella sp. IMCC44653]
MDTIKEEFKGLVLELINVPTEIRESEILERLDIISPDPGYMDYIYHSEHYYDDDDNFDAEALTEKVFSYKPIIF